MKQNWSLLPPPGYNENRQKNYLIFLGTPRTAGKKNVLFQVGGSSGCSSCVTLESMGSLEKLKERLMNRIFFYLILAGVIFFSNPANASAQGRGYGGRGISGGGFYQVGNRGFGSGPYYSFGSYPMINSTGFNSTYYNSPYAYGSNRFGTYGAFAPVGAPYYYPRYNRPVSNGYRYQQPRFLGPR